MRYDLVVTGNVVTPDGILRGGATIAGPFDTPVGRTAVLADPAGAAFSVTRIAVPQ